MLKQVPNNQLKNTLIDYQLMQLQSSYVLLTKGIADFTTDELQIHLPNGGSSAFWMFGHLAVNEDLFLSLLHHNKRKSTEQNINKFQDDNSCFKSFHDIEFKEVF